MSASTSISQNPIEDLEVKIIANDTESNNWSALEDGENPYKWTTKRKWLFTVVICLNNFMVSVGASIFTPGIGLIAYNFDVTTVVATLGLSFYVIGFATGPLIFAPMSEVYGRKIVCVPTWVLFVIFQLGCALAKNIETLVICRLLVGTFGSPALTVAAGTMTDIWEPNELGPPMGLFTMAAFLGPVVGPIAGGFITEYIQSSEPWRWSFWIPLIISGVLGLNWFWLPETYQLTLLENKAKRAGHKALHMEGRKSNAAIFRVAVWRPLHMLVFEPTVLLVSLYISFLFGILYLYFGAYPLIFQGRYHWGPGFSGLAFVGIGVGVVLSFLTAGYSNKLYLQLKEKKNKGATYPEGRLPLAIAAALLVPGSIFWFAWSGFAKVHWIVPVLSGVPFGWSMVVLFISLISYLAEGYLEYSASVIAANTILRSLFAMAFPLFGRTMYTALKPEWAGTLLGCISILFMPIPFLFFKYGWWLRQNSRYPTKQQLAARDADISHEAERPIAPPNSV